MSSKAFKLSAEVRSNIGKGASRRLRRDDKIPAVVYGGNEEAQSLVICHHELARNLNDDAFYSQIIDMSINGEEQEVILRDLQRHPYKPLILHADFQRIVRGQELSVNVPIHYINVESSVGVKAGGIFSQNIIDVEVTCRPRNLPEAIEVDVAELDVNDSIRLSEITLPEGVRITSLENATDEDANVVVASIHPPKTEKAEETTEEASSEEVATEE